MVDGLEDYTALQPISFEHPKCVNFAKFGVVKNHLQRVEG